MSTRNDLYLSLCLEQASKSPLHYRHGCIIVRGGKVLGSGFNDFRAGFDGGALKTGQICNRKKQRQRSSATSSFVPFEATGAGTGSNTPLSMHSEMMAIQTALSASPESSAANSSKALSSQKSCFNLSGPSKHSKRLRKQVLKDYVERIFHEADQLHQTNARRAQPSVQPYCFEPGAEVSQSSSEHRALELQQSSRERPSEESEIRVMLGNVFAVCAAPAQGCAFASPSPPTDTLETTQATTRPTAAA